MGLDIDRLERGSYSLMPLVYRRLSDAGVEEPHLPRLKGIYRHTWSKNQVLLENLRVVTEKLREGGVDVLIVGGAARLPYYGEVGERTVSDFELLVREVDLERALRAVGWNGGPVPDRVARARSAVRVGGQEHRAFGLYWRFLPEFPAAGDDDIWRAAGQTALEGIEGLALDPADELLATCTGGARTALWANVQWVADAVVIIRSGRLDWERLERTARVRRATLRMREALGYVGDLLQAPVPEEVLRALVAVPATPRDRVAHKISGSGGKAFGELPGTLARYIRSGEGVLALPRFLRDTWNVDRSWQLPVAVARKGVKTIVARRSKRP
ncbi:MAG: nucleotidyltransferase family protein [Actinobacteria bacterium]|nr:nucleotidyltransferase family protein [Actinomycetota bacterium]